MKVAVIGAAGHVGLPFSLVLSAKNGLEVIGIDLNRELIEQLNNGIVPYIEPGAKEILHESLKNKTIRFTTDSTQVKEAQVVCIMIGTPIDNMGNASVEDIHNYFTSLHLMDAIKGKVFILRSTVIPGTTRNLIRMLTDQFGYSRKDFSLFYCPERVSQHNGIKETKDIPQLFGSDETWDFTWQVSEGVLVAASIFTLNPRSVLANKNDVWNEATRNIIFLTHEEAELAKLVTNMYRYVNFAFANEFYMICNNAGVNADRVIEAANKDYPRMKMDKPGFAAGPCLYKDGQFLLGSVPYTELIRGAFTINENIVNYLWGYLKDYPRPKKVLLLGASFKKGSDDTRNSLTFRMAKILKREGVDYDIFDPLVKKYAAYPDITRYDMIIGMTVHKEIKDWFELRERDIRPGTIVADIGKTITKATTTGVKVY